jgi:hypothetical protein
MSASPAVARPQSDSPAYEIRGQRSFPGFCPIAEAVETLATGGGIEARGAIFTRREVVDFLLDLSGYTHDRPLHALRLLEPSFGGGDFLLPAVERLLAGWKDSGDVRDPVEALSDCLRAVSSCTGKRSRKPGRGLSNSWPRTALAIKRPLGLPTRGWSMGISCSRSFPAHSTPSSATHPMSGRN